MPRVLCLLVLIVFASHVAAEDKTPPLSDPKFHAQLIEIAKSYSEWKLADPDMRVAPNACDAYPGTPPGALRGVLTSKSNDTSTHGKKLYYVYPKDLNAYKPLQKTQPVGQVLVKESWVPLIHEGDNVANKRLTPGDLFILFKLDPKTPGTDEGWVYGTLSAEDHRTVTSAGRVASCMKCHEDAKSDRVFGLPKLDKK